MPFNKPTVGEGALRQPTDKSLQKGRIINPPKVLKDFGAGSNVKVKRNGLTIGKPGDTK